jgi:NAD(P)H-dependent FMN reductase
MRILTLCGSLRARSSNRAILRAYETVAGSAIECTHYERMDALPHFNPDLDGEGAPLPHEVGKLRDLVKEADALVISTPEYAHGLPGSFKNVLDWLVSYPPFAGKRVAVLQAARGSTWAVDSLREILKTMSAVLLEDASVSLPLGTNQMDEVAILAREDLRELLERSIETLIGAMR